MLVCALALGLGSAAAQAETTGIYVAPKFMMMWQNNWSDMDVTGVQGGQGSASLGKSQFTLGGALAVGYDFYPQHKLPIRAEIEFAMRGDNKLSDDSSTSYKYTTTGPDTFHIEGIINEEINVKYNASTLMANLYYDFHNSSAFTPYVMGGVGLAFINAKYEYNVNRKEKDLDHGTLQSDSASVSENKNFTNFAWALGAGCAYNFNENFAVDLGYRYVNLGSVKTDGSGSFAGANFNYEGKSFASNHEIMLGLRYTF